jgi:hypothetical protein
MAAGIETAIREIALDDEIVNFPRHQKITAEQNLDSRCSEHRSSRGCTQLQGPRTGYARQFAWCTLCKEVAMRTRGRPIPGSPLLLLMSGQTVHTDPSCPRTENSREFRRCMYCTEYNGYGSLSCKGKIWCSLTKHPRGSAEWHTLFLSI